MGLSPWPSASRTLLVSAAGIPLNGSYISGSELADLYCSKDSAFKIHSLERICEISAGDTPHACSTNCSIVIPLNRRPSVSSLRRGRSLSRVVLVAPVAPRLRGVVISKIGEQYILHEGRGRCSPE